jgi:predicted Zn-dependent protease
MNWIFALTICACAALPGCGVTELGLQPVEIDRELGEEASRAVALRMGIANQPKATAYLNDVGHRLAAQVPDQRFSYVFQIVDQPEPNAFAAPAGYIFVSRGLLLLVNSEDELANVLSHEIVHVARRHVARQRSQQTVPSLLTLPGRAAGAIIGGEVGGAISAPFENLTRGWIASYSREHEHSTALSWRPTSRHRLETKRPRSSERIRRRPTERGASAARQPRSSGSPAPALRRTGTHS